MKSTLSFLNKLTCSLSLLFALDRLAKLAAVIHFFHRPAPPQLEVWPTVTARPRAGKYSPACFERRPHDVRLP